MQTSNEPRKCLGCGRMVRPKSNDFPAKHNLPVHLRSTGNTKECRQASYYVGPFAEGGR